MDIKAVVCYSGGHSSALTAVEAVRRYGRENVILLNHDISPHVEHEDIKRFKREIAEYLGVEITYANMDGWETLDPLKLSVKNKAFQFVPGRALCTLYLKTEPFQQWLRKNYPAWQSVLEEKMLDNFVILYGFDNNEGGRIARRRLFLMGEGYKTEFPLAEWERTIQDTEEIGIAKPSTYNIYKHANCIGCLKAGKQHWYCVYCLRPDIWDEAKQAEAEIGYSIIKDVFLAELEPQFEEMRYEKNICPTEKGNSAAFWARVKSAIPEQLTLLPCDCSI
jgi:hypothetical protein